MEKKSVFDWFLRFIKGAVIGLEVSVPGISAAAMSVVFGLYERIVGFVANINKDFLKNVLFFLPVAFGGLVGIYLSSYPMSFLYENYQTPVLWFFIGTILGTMPDLWHKSGKNGRKPIHFVMLTFSFIFTTIFLLFSSAWVLGQINLNPTTAFGAGAIFALTSLIPGFSSSNIWVMFGFYDQMQEAIKALNMGIIIPFVVGIGIFIIPFSKVIKHLIEKTFTGFFHVIIGIVLASVVLIGAIASENYNYWQIWALVCVLTFIAGAIFSYNMCRLSRKYE